jgi:uncharacterized protein Yka (UPF0111/DUF47 family)
MTKTTEEIQKAIELLKENKTKTPELSLFGDNNHETLDHMIDVLENEVEFDDMEEKIGIEKMMDVGGIYEWLDGQTELDDLLFPERS